MKLTLVQILVQVATTQMKSLSIEVGEGSITILISYGLIAPKCNSEN